MKLRVLLLFILLLAITSCESGKTKQQSEKVENSDATPLDILTSKDLSLKIYFEKSKVRHCDSLKVGLIVKNISDKSGTLLFDNPKDSNPGIWFLNVLIYDLETQKSVVKYSNRRIIKSDVTTKEEYENSFYQLKPNQVIKRTFPLSSNVIYSTENYELPKGKYRAFFLYKDLKSNEVLFEIY